MELKLGKQITCKWQNQRLETNKYVLWALLLKLQTAELNFEKLLGWNPNNNYIEIALKFLLRYFNLPLTF